MRLAQPDASQLLLKHSRELLQRMDDPDARYSIALPDMQQFRRLWQRLPQLAKARTTISALFVSPSGNVEEVLFPVSPHC